MIGEGGRAEALHRRHHHRHVLGTAACHHRIDRGLLGHHDRVAAGDLVNGRLSDLPHITYCERDAGPYITAGVFLAKEPGTGIPNLSFCRSMMVSDEKLRVRLAPPHDITKYQKKAEARNEALEVAILLGPPPEVFLAACASVPTEVDELAIAAVRIAGRGRAAV